MDPLDAARIASQAALAVPEADRAVFVVTGADRLTWLNGLVTCDLAKLGSGEARYGLFVEKKGRVVADAIVLRDDPRVLVAVPRGPWPDLRALLDKHLVMEDAEMTELDASFTWVHGPRAGEVLAAMKAAGAAGATLDLHRARRGGRLRREGRRRDVQSARDAALAAIGGAAGDARAWDALRVERRVPVFGVDFDGARYPQEAGLEKRAVAFDKGCYLGQEVVCMLELRGQVKQRLVALRLDAGEPPAKGAEVKDAAGEAVGAVKSAAATPGGTIAIAMVKRKKSDDGTELAVGGARAIRPRRVRLTELSTASDSSLKRRCGPFDSSGVTLSISSAISLMRPSLPTFRCRRSPSLLSTSERPKAKCSTTSPASGNAESSCEVTTGGRARRCGIAPPSCPRAAPGRTASASALAAIASPHALGASRVALGAARGGEGTRRARSTGVLPPTRRRGSARRSRRRTSRRPTRRACARARDCRRPRPPLRARRRARDHLAGERLHAAIRLAREDRAEPHAELAAIEPHASFDR